MKAFIETYYKLEAAVLGETVKRSAIIHGVVGLLLSVGLFYIFSKCGMEKYNGTAVASGVSTLLVFVKMVTDIMLKKGKPSIMNVISAGAAAITIGAVLYNVVK